MTDCCWETSRETSAETKRKSRSATSWETKGKSCRDKLPAGRQEGIQLLLTLDGVRLVIE